MAVASNYDYTGVAHVDDRSSDDRTTRVPRYVARHVESTQYIVTGGTMRGRFALSGRSGSSRGRADAHRRRRLARSFDRAARRRRRCSRRAQSARLDGRGRRSRVRRDASSRRSSFVSTAGSVGARSTDDRVDTTAASRDELRRASRPACASRTSGSSAASIRRDSVRSVARRRCSTRCPRLGDRHACADGRRPDATARGDSRPAVALIDADVVGDSLERHDGLLSAAYQTRSELFVQTNLLDRFPTGDFGLMASIVHEYRSAVHFPSLDERAVARRPGYRTISLAARDPHAERDGLLAVPQYAGERYSAGPGLHRCRGRRNFYGVRWDVLRIDKSSLSVP